MVGFIACTFYDSNTMKYKIFLQLDYDHFSTPIEEYDV